MSTVGLFARSDASSTMDPTMRNLLIALIVLVVFGLCLVGALFFVRHHRKVRKSAREELPMYNEKRVSNHRRLTITANSGPRTESIYVYDEKRTLIENPQSPPDSPIPEIRITFPEEVDETGKRQSGRVVVVRVGEHSVGLEPLQEDLPPYQQDASDRFQSIDLERVGGLKEKNEYS